MTFEMPLLEVIAKLDTEAARKLIVPWQREKFPHPSVLMEDGSYWNFSNYGSYAHPGDCLQEKQPKLGEIIFDKTGEFQHKRLPDYEVGKKGLVNLLLGVVPPQSVWEEMEGHPIPDKGCAFVLPLQFVYLVMFSPDAKLVMVPQMSGRMLVSESKPIIYYVKPGSEAKDAIGVLLPHKHLVEVPEMFRVQTQ